MIILMGVAGSGKSMQGRLLADELALPWLSTGEFLRMLISGAPRKDMLAGKLLDDKEIIQLMRKVFAVVDTQHGVVLDGFPRTLAQADWLLNQVKHGQLSLTAVVHLKSSVEVVRRRLLGRGRPDDNEAAIAERFKEYEQAVMPIIEHFRQADVPVFDIDGEQSPGKVHRDILQAVQRVRHVHADQDQV